MDNENDDSYDGYDGYDCCLVYFAYLCFEHYPILNEFMKLTPIHTPLTADWFKIKSKFKIRRRL